MNNDFHRILTFIRKERGLSQKQVSIDLNISQALLSHYESGRRECGLEFIVNAADYYDVSCDYLLGRSPDRQGRSITIDDTSNTGKKEHVTHRNTLSMLNKTLITNSVSVLFSLLNKCRIKGLTAEISTFLMLAVYRAFRLVYKANPENNKEFFSVNDILSSAKAMAAMRVSEAKADLAISSTKKKDKVTDESAITYQSLNNDYPAYAASLLNLINQCEKKMEQY